MNSSLVGVNVALDVFLARIPWDHDSARVIQAGIEGKFEVHLASFSLTTLFYIVRRHSGLIKAHDVVKMCLDNFQIVRTDREMLDLPTEMPGHDFEDNVQIASAVLCELDAIVTRDPKEFVYYSIPVYSPSDLMESISQHDL